MDIRVTTFTSPFSFFCVINDSALNTVTSLENDVDTGNVVTKKSVSDINHGEYVAVMWNQKWTRGVITMECRFLIWLIDYGIYLRPDDKLVYVDLPLEYKKHPTKVFEASLHGVTPVDKCITDDCHIENKVTTSWNKGAVEKSQQLLKSATKVYFVPVAILSTKFNDVVIGDMYLDIPGKGIIDMVDELVLWPVFVERNNQVYIQNLSKYYTNRRKHRACSLKPEFLNFKLPIITLRETLEDYTSLTENKPQLIELLRCNCNSKDGSTDCETDIEYKQNKDAYRLTQDEIEEYSNSYITVNGKEYNVLNVLVNKARDLKICERYKDHDLKSIGRATSFRCSYRKKSILNQET